MIKVVKAPAGPGQWVLTSADGPAAICSHYRSSWPETGQRWRHTCGVSLTQDPDQQAHDQHHNQARPPVIEILSFRNTFLCSALSVTLNGSKSQEM